MLSRRLAVLILRAILNEWLKPFVWLVLRETAAISAHFLYPPYTSLQRSCLGCMPVICRLHFWQKDWNILHVTVVARGWNGYLHKSQRRKSTMEKNFSRWDLDLQSWVWHSVTELSLLLFRLVKWVNGPSDCYGFMDFWRVYRGPGITPVHYLTREVA